MTGVYIALGGFALSGFAAFGSRCLRDFSIHDLEEYCLRKGSRQRLTDILDHHDDRGDICPCGTNHLAGDRSERNELASQMNDFGFCVRITTFTARNLSVRQQAIGNVSSS